jgi:uncharacterized protein with von Willebrand factor type A (vWA) domain
MDLLRRKKNKNKQIFMITDGKPTCLKEGIRYYKNSFGLDPKILKKTLNLAAQCRKIQIPITVLAQENLSFFDPIKTLDWNPNVGAI